MDRAAQARPAIPQFVEGEAGALFALEYPPAAVGPLAGLGVLHVPALAEEMNKSRAVVAAQARALAAAGAAVLVPDLYGSGDSDGDFAQATWAIWQRDILRCAGWLEDRGARSVVLWGLRLGVLLALDVARGADRRFRHFLLWQAPASGQALLTQFLRLRTAASMMQGRQESTAELREILAQGSPVEVAGYALDPALALPLEALEMNALAPVEPRWVIWLEVGAAAGPGVSPGASRILASAAWTGLPVVTGTAAGAPFWQTQEIAQAPALLALTGARLAEVLAA